LAFPKWSGDSSVPSSPSFKASGVKVPSSLNKSGGSRPPSSSILKLEFQMEIQLWSSGVLFCLQSLLFWGVQSYFFLPLDSRLSLLAVFPSSPSGSRAGLLTSHSSCPWSWSHWFVARWLSGWTSRHHQSGREVGLTFSPNGSSSIWYYCGWVSERVTAQICQMSRLPIGPPTNLCWTFHRLLPVRPQQTVHHVAVPNHHSSRWPYRGCWRCRTDRIPGKHKTWCLLGYWHARETQDLRWLLTQRRFRFRKCLNSSSSLLVGVVLNWRFRVNRILLMMDQIRGQAAHVAWTKQPRPYFFIIQDRDQSLKSDWGSFFKNSVTL